jgi:hypothetical protein
LSSACGRPRRDVRPLQHAIERLLRRRIEPGGRGTRGRTRERAAPVQHFLANGHADAFLELEAHER